MSSFDIIEGFHAAVSASTKTRIRIRIRIVVTHDIDYFTLPCLHS